LLNGCSGGTTQLKEIIKYLLKDKASSTIAFDFKRYFHLIKYGTYEIFRKGFGRNH
jgi:hypothetical protein